MREASAGRTKENRKKLECRPMSGAAMLVGAAIIILQLPGCLQDRFALTQADLDKIREADRAYADAWQSNDSSAVMATLSSDPIILPSGMPAIEGSEAIRDFWWPEGAPLTTVHRFDLEQHESGGQGDFAFVRGSFLLAFEYADQDYASAGEYLSVLERREDGAWRISHRMWSDRPVETAD